MPCIQKVEVTVFGYMILTVFLCLGCTGHLSQYVFSQAYASYPQVINQPFNSTLESI